VPVVATVRWITTKEGYVALLQATSAPAGDTRQTVAPPPFQHIQVEVDDLAFRHTEGVPVLVALGAEDQVEGAVAPVGCA